MARNRIRIDGYDADGKHHAYQLDGVDAREDLLKIAKVMETLGLMDIEDQGTVPKTDTIGAKIGYIVDKFFPMGKFTSNAVLEKYEDEFNEPIKLSVISTYLSRFSTKGRITRTRTGREWTYQTIKLGQKQR